MGVADARLMMSCLNINPPDGRGLQRKLNQMCDRVEAINEESVVENQRYVWRVNMLRGEGDTVDLETDTSYNNRTQAGFKAATQSFSPMVEASMPRKLVVSLQTANKLCCCAHLPGYSTKFFLMENIWIWNSPTWMPFSPSSVSISGRMVFGKSASWQPLTGVRTSISVSSRRPPRTPHGPGTSQPCAILQSTPPRMAPASPW